MFLNQISSEFVRTIVLAVCGLLIGAFCNYAIYQWRWFWRSILPVSPWQFVRRRQYDSVAEDKQKLSRQSSLDFVPVLGWLLKSRDSQLLGRGFWIRPLMIELAFAIGLPMFFAWQTRGGLFGLEVVPAARDAEIWFWGYTILIALMAIATFIDFDEKTIPDKVTIFGTVAGLMFAAAAPNFRLPEMIGPGLWQSVTFCSPGDIPAANWHHEWSGLLVSLGIMTVWVFALLPFIFRDDVGFFQRTRFALGSVIRPPRKTKCKVGRDQVRGPKPVTRLMVMFWIVLIISVVAAWFTLRKGIHWDSLFGAIVGFGVGGGLVWSVRVVAGWALQKEAMGFGDVTLMAMIGAFLGWQAAVLTFFLAPVGGMLITLAQFIFTRKGELAFGPYLCGTATLLLFFWSELWPPAADGFFFVGGKGLAITLGGVLVLMALMLYGIQALKQLMGIVDKEEEPVAQEPPVDEAKKKRDRKKRQKNIE